MLLSRIGGMSSVTRHLVSSKAVINLVISTSVSNFNIKNAVGSAYVPGATEVLLTIESGKHIGADGPALYALDTGSGWQAGDSIKIVNHGYIAGYKGSAGNGGSYYSQSGGPGGVGGPAMNLQFPVSIDNTDGYIFSGGGGGGGGGGNGSGSGGSGHAGAAGAGSYGAVLATTYGNPCSGTGGQTSGVGAAIGVAGAAGAGYQGGTGGSGGGGGANGGAAYQAGGGHGLAVTTNGNAITWVAGQARTYGGIT